ncbi:hypothetical protein FBZ96_11247 [Bradyrhizobium stylosanthis]|uniref:Uncharacterized protein n=1 Tax=Bradyrhizobium stylosanthis TaxID=1803665 RepID=A0A560D4N7_9BRAD|nr:hypothetical protein FBZ96_11247 [Bradyrhizobium stylosanthis]
MRGPFGISILKNDDWVVLSELEYELSGIRLVRQCIARRKLTL